MYLLVDYASINCIKKMKILRILKVRFSRQVGLS